MAVAVADQPRHQIIAPGTGDRIFARGINLGDADHIGLVETGAEILEQAGQARIAMGLMHRDHAAFAGLTRGFQHGGDLDRVMAVIVDDGDAAHLAHLGEAAVDALETRQCTANFIGLHAQMAGHGNGRQSVGDIVITRHGQGATFDHLPLGLQRDVEMRDTGFVA